MQPFKPSYSYSLPPVSHANNPPPVLLNRHGLQNNALYNNNTMVAQLNPLNKMLYHANSSSHRPLNGCHPSFDGQQEILYSNGSAIGVVQADGSILNGPGPGLLSGSHSSQDGKSLCLYEYGRPFNGSNSYHSFYKSQIPLLYENGYAIGEIGLGGQVSKNGVSVNGAHISFNGIHKLLYQNGQSIGLINPNGQIATNGTPLNGHFIGIDGVKTIIYKNGWPHSGLHQDIHNPESLLCDISYYEAGEAKQVSHNNRQSEALKVLPLTEHSLWIKQDGAGDCYLLALMHGILSQPSGFEQAHQMISLNANGDLCIKFITNKTLRSGISRLNNPVYIQNMQYKGYTVQLISENEVNITISAAKVQLIAGDSGAAKTKTNSLFIKCLEHLIPNLFNARHNTAPNMNESTLLHTGRSEHYDDLVANLFNYTKSGQVRAVKDKATLISLLQEILQRKLTTPSADQGFVYVWLNINARGGGQFHGSHALTLQRINHDPISGVPISITLTNPWDTTELNKYTYPLDEVIQRKSNFEIISPGK